MSHKDTEHFQRWKRDGRRLGLVVGLEVNGVVRQVLRQGRRDRCVGSLLVVEVQEPKQGNDETRELSPNVRVDRTGIDGNGPESPGTVPTVQLDGKQQSRQFGRTVRTVVRFVLFLVVGFGKLGPVRFVVSVGVTKVVHDARQIHDAGIVGLEQQWFQEVVGEEKVS